MQPKPVIRISPDGSILKFESVTAAAKEHGGDDYRCKITRAIKTGIKHYGYNWGYGRAHQKRDFPHIKKLPNVLLLDIETAPMQVFSWTLFKPRLNYENIVSDWFILGWSAKWLHGSDMMSDFCTPEEAVNCDDERVCGSVYEVMDKADIIIGHNVQKFDIRKINSRFIIHGIRRPSPYQTIDTLRESRKNFAHSSHRLDYLGQLLVRKAKLETDFSLWKRCVQGEQEALNYMNIYCDRDILLLEEVYMEMRGWIKSHPNLAHYVETDEPICPTCMSNKLELCGEYVTMASVYDSFRCGNCGSIGRLRKSKLTPVDRGKLTISVAR